MLDDAALAEALDRAAVDAVDIERLTLSNTLDLERAYAVQKLLIARMLSRGDTLAGVKMGFTSLAKMRQMGVSETIWGRLTNGMRVEDGGELSLQPYIHARAEPEVAFLLKRPLRGAVSPAEAMAAVDAVAPAIEIIDSRFKDFKFTYHDVVADNCSSSGFVLGAWQRPCELSNLGVLLEVDGLPVQIGSTAAILGDPARALAAASRLAESGGDPLQEGWIVLAGAATEAVALRPGVHVRVSVQNLGVASFAVQP